MDPYTIYGDLADGDTVALTTILVAKGLSVEFVPESASLSLSLASRAGSISGPYLRTPEGFVLSGLHATLDWIERMHPEPALMPTMTKMPVRQTCARLLEDWIELWLPLWPRRSWTTLERIGAHLDAAGFLLGRDPSRPDWLFAAWLETKVLVHDHARAHLAGRAPRLNSLGDDLLDSTAAGAIDPTDQTDQADDVIPISLLGLREEIAGDYHAYIIGNQRAIKDESDRVMLDLGLGRRALPVRLRCEERRVEIGRGLEAMDPQQRHDVRRVLAPVGAWYALTLPSVLPEIDPGDPRSL